VPRCAICKKANSVGNGGLKCKCKGKEIMINKKLKCKHSGHLIQVVDIVYDHKDRELYKCINLHPDDDPDEFYNSLKELCMDYVHPVQEYRKTKGFTQQQLADSLGCSLQSIKYWETGRREPSEEWKVKLKERGVEV
jgi:DNA-binding XRE family transcriptional regulator